MYRRDRYRPNRTCTRVSIMVFNAPTAIAVNAGRAAFHAATGGVAGVAGGRTSRFPIPGRVPISERPPEAGDRSGFGHWEADGVIGARMRPAH